jgi:hypothetical protein
VTEKLSDVRGRIEQLQGEMKFLTAQIDMSSLEISLPANADAAVAGIHWKPLRQAKIAVGEMIAGLADWVDAVIAFLSNLPLVGVWLLSVVVLVVISFASCGSCGADWVPRPAGDCRGCVRPIAMRLARIRRFRERDGRY